MNMTLSPTNALTTITTTTPPSEAAVTTTTTAAATKTSAAAITTTTTTTSPPLTTTTTALSIGTSQIFPERNTMDTYTFFSRPTTPKTPTIIGPSLAFTSCLTFTNPTINNTRNNNNDNHDNMTREEVLEYLEMLQKEELMFYFPTLSFLILIAAVGLLGNTLVLLVYKNRYRRRPKRMFIMAVAAFDLIGSVICIPTDVYSIFHLWNYTQPTLCRLTRFTYLLIVNMSGGLLLGLAIDRYLQICRPFGKQMTLRRAKMAITGFAFYSCLLATPYSIIAGIRTRPTTRAGVFGYRCSIDEPYVDTIWPFVSSAISLLGFLFVFISMIVLYILIGIQAFKLHRKMCNRNMKKMTLSDDSIQREANSERKQKETDIDRYPKEVETDDRMNASSNSLAQSSAYNTTDSDVDHETDHNSKSHPISNFSRSTSPHKTDRFEARETIKIESNGPDGECLSSRLRWMDITRGNSHTFQSGSGENSLQVTPTKKTPILRTNSMDRIMFQQQIGRPKGFIEKSKKGRNSCVQDVEMDVTNLAKVTFETEEDITDAPKARQTNIARRKKNSFNNNKVQRSSSSAINRRGSINRTTVMLILITSVFVLTYIPALAVFLHQSLQPDKVKVMGRASLAIYFLSFRSGALNFAVNAIIYSLCDKKFRMESLKLLRCKQ